MGISVAYPYASDDWRMGHLGDAYVPPDILGRCRHMQGKDVILVSGSDPAEHEEILRIAVFADHARRLWLDQPLRGRNVWFPGPPSSVARSARIGQPPWPSWHLKLP